MSKNRTRKGQITDDNDHPRWQQVAALMEVFDQDQFYPTEWIIYDDTIIVAEENYKGVPGLTIQPVDQWLEEHDWDAWIEFKNGEWIEKEDR